MCAIEREERTLRTMRERETVERSTMPAREIEERTMM